MVSLSSGSSPLSRTEAVLIALVTFIKAAVGS